jgi:hypothetical protein
VSVRRRLSLMSRREFRCSSRDARITSRESSTFRHVAWNKSGPITTASSLDSMGRLQWTHFAPYSMASPLRTRRTRITRPRVPQWSHAPSAISRSSLRLKPNVAIATSWPGRASADAMHGEQIEPSVAATTSRIRGHNVATIATRNYRYGNATANVKFAHLSTAVHSQRWTYMPSVYKAATPGLFLSQLAQATPAGSRAGAEWQPRDSAPSALRRRGDLESQPKDHEERDEEPAATGPESPLSVGRHMCSCPCAPRVCSPAAEICDRPPRLNRRTPRKPHPHCHVWHANMGRSFHAPP